MSEIILTERLRNDYKVLPLAVQKKLKKQIRFLAENPKHPSLQTHRIQGTPYWDFILTGLIAAFSGRMGISITCSQLDLTKL